MSESQEQVNDLLRALQERAKELNCLYRFHKLLEQPGTTLEDIFNGVLDILRPSFRYSEFICARLVYEKTEFKTDNFRETKWSLRRPVECCQEAIGFIEEMQHDGIGGDELRHLSMGMSQDYAVAVEEGATLLRIGSALLT